MKKQVLLALFALQLTSCSIFYPHKMDVQQGNVFTDAEVKQLHNGMSKARVTQIMGRPIMKQTFPSGREDYVYTNQPGGQKMQLKRITLHFNRSGNVSSIEKIS